MDKLRWNRIYQEILDTQTLYGHSTPLSDRIGSYSRLINLAQVSSPLSPLSLLSLSSLSLVSSSLSILWTFDSFVRSHWKGKGKGKGKEKGEGEEMEEEEKK